MGKKLFKRFSKNRRRPDQPKKERPAKSDYESVVRENKKLEEYYKAQNIVPEDEWDEFITCMKQNLPAAFRITGTKLMAHALMQVMLKTFFEPLSKLVPPELTPEEITAGEEPVKVLKPKYLPWYPDNFAWQLNLTRRDIRRCEPYWQLHQFLISETETGNISRQEAVSMTPPLVLDIKPHHKILDLCAAPGSKTAQLIEYLHRSEDEYESSIPPGIVVANDVDNKRCYMLTHQAKRLQSPSVLITNHDAAFMPNIFHERNDKSVVPIKFDRILCDVPCSGDGTLRKNFDVWSKWNSINGANLHGLQLRIARRGLEMLAVGGQMVYSTCSLNPLENEAVVQRLLLEGDGSVQLVDITDKLPGLKFMPGLEDWVIINKDMEVIKTPDDIPLKNSNLYNKHQFPPTEDQKAILNLKRCIRILPHHQDTGGFFVALLEKVKRFPGEKVYNESSETSTGGNLTATQRIKQPPKKKRRPGYKEEPFYYFEPEEEIWPALNSFYGFKEDVDSGLFLSRTNEGKKRNIYYTNKLVRDVVQLNQNTIKIINTGVKVLVRSDNKGAACDFRLAQEGAEVLLPLFTKRKMKVTSQDMVKMLQNDDMELPPEIRSLHLETQKQCEGLSTGAIALNYKDSDGHLSIDLVGWKGNKSLRAYVAKNDRIHYLRLLGADHSKYEKNKYKMPYELKLRKDKESAEKKEEENGEDSQMDNGSSKQSQEENHDAQKSKDEILPADGGAENIQLNDVAMKSTDDDESKDIHQS